MADKNIGLLPQASTLTDNSSFVCEDSGEAKRVTGKQFKDFAKQGVSDEAAAQIQAIKSAGNTQTQRVIDEGKIQTANAKAQANAAAQAATGATQSAQEAASSASVASAKANEAAESARSAEDNASKAAESARTAANSAYSASSSEINAMDAESSALNHANNAKNHATAAAQSATDAQSAMTAAQTAQSGAEAAHSAAESAASSASTSARQASVSEQNAAGSASAAKASEDAAKSSENTAAGSASSAQESAASASASASEASASATAAAASETSAVEAKTVAETAKTEAGKSASAAKKSETASKASETAAAGSASAAQQSASAAEGSAMAAAQSAASIGNAEQVVTQKAEEASTSAANAAASAESAARSAEHAEQVVGGDFATKTEAQGYANTAESNAKSYTDQQISAIPTPDVSGQIGEHNTNTESHNDIRNLITGLTNRLNALADSDDTTLDQLSEIVAYIKNNKALIDGITTSKVNVTDIINNLTTNVTNKPLSAAQGVALKALIDAITVPTKVSELENDSGYLTSYTETDPTVPAWAKAKSKPTYTASEVGAVPTSRTVNGKALNSNITLNASDVNARPNTWTPSASDVGALPISGGTVTGNITAKYLTGTWLQATESNHSSTTAEKVAVFDTNGWLYHRTPNEILSDIGAAKSSHNHDSRYYTESEMDTKLAGKSGTNHDHVGMVINPASIELNPGTSAGHGGYIDFHFNGDSADYTSRIYEPVKGTLKYNGHRILSSANIVALFNVNITFTNGVATYKNSAINSSSVTFVQWRAGAVSTLTDSVLSTTPQNGSMKIIAKNGLTGGPLPVNILIINL